MNLTNATALITGGSSGIGYAIAKTLVASGARVAITGRHRARLVEAEKELGVYAINADVSKEEDVQRTYAEVLTAFGHLDILVNNAGIAVAGLIHELALEDWRRQMATNVDGVFLGVKAALPLMRKGKSGSIINISSIAGLRGAPNLSAYCTSKGAVRLFTKSVALECAAMQDGIRCNSVHPGLIETPIWSQVVPGSNEPMDLDAAAALRVPMRRKGWPDDIAKVVLFLASDDSGYMTGEEVVVDGGMTVGT